MRASAEIRVHGGTYAEIVSTALEKAALFLGVELDEVENHADIELEIKGSPGATNTYVATVYLRIKR